ncbi:MAG: class I SAM-dependent methyltransferase [Deltaproteobacteria bacterium]|nr:class I SAM-dependent methyltransferase [Deltaproteobacteria bacterium]
MTTSIASRVALVFFLALLPTVATWAEPLSAAEARALAASPDRADEDREKDARRHPAELLVFAGASRGMKAADLGAGNGYTTELLARAAGPEGSVIGHNTPTVVEKFVSESWPARLAKPVNSNVTRVDSGYEEPLPEGTSGLDLITMIYVYHDTLFGGVDRAAMNERLFRALRPRGALVVVDHFAVEGAGPESGKTVHRIDEALLRRELEAAGFVLEAKADFMRNPDDPRTELFFKMDGPTDSFVHRYVRPAGLPDAGLALEPDS